ncbi:unnamed protein product [Rotaria sp. Silwood1]|nr:unnamed protein product [Rotaria sp. Silwood1]
MYTGANMVEMQNGAPNRPIHIHVASDQLQECAFPRRQQLKLANDRRMCVCWNDENATDEVDCPSRICNGTNSMKFPTNNICI